MKKIILLVLLLSIALPGCKKNKLKVKNRGTIVNSTKREGDKVVSEQADEFALEDDESFNVFEDEEKKKVENGASEGIEWNEVENDSQYDRVQFGYDSSEINPSEKAKITKNAKNLKKYLSKDEKATVKIKGHSCKIAKNKEYNYVLSQERAENVAKEYEANGIERDRMKPVGYGASMLLTDADGMQAQSPNRRVETSI